jgi:hypothetical protein
MPEPRLDVMGDSVTEDLLELGSFEKDIACEQFPAMASFGSFYHP